jgi:YD repeat-containing protein
LATEAGVNPAYGYDAVGNLTGTADLLTFSVKCYGYDSWNRLVRTASAPLTIPPCQPPPSGADTVFDAADRIMTGPAGGYTYATPGKPDAVSSIATAGGIDTYTYDAVGNRTSWSNADGDDFSYTWDVQGRMLTATSQGGASAYLYDVDRTQLLRKDPQGVWLNLDGVLELQWPNGSWIRGTRSYTIDGVLVGIRNPWVNEWFLGDERGSVAVTVDYASGTVMRSGYTSWGDVNSSSAPPPSTSNGSSPRPMNHTVRFPPFDGHLP